MVGELELVNSIVQALEYRIHNTMSKSFVIPQRRVVTDDDLKKWEASETYSDVVQFVTDLSESVTGKTNDEECFVSDTVKGLLDLLEEVVEIISRHPVKDRGSSRFGKPEFRDVYDELAIESKQLLHRHIPQVARIEGDPTKEISSYFIESWGNRTRIDYGSGHELNFIAFLLSLQKLGIIDKRDHTALVLKVFNKYMSVMRILQREYWLEPAGSHGVWGLDDYHFMPFLFGASQLSTHKYLRPKSIHNAELVEELHSKYMYFECIYFINNIKTASLRWHSPMLDDISGVKKWSKVAEGMIKMFKAEVLGKLPIVQHFLFGSILQAPEGCSPPLETHTDDCCGDPHNSSNQPSAVHQHTWGDCCGIKLPSALAASEMNKSKPIPFD